MYRKTMEILAVLIISIVSLMQATADENNTIVFINVNAEFEEIRSDIQSAILNQSFVIDFNATVGVMLNRTSADLGIEDPVYLRAENWQFCSASLSHKMVLADPMNLAFCPFVIFAYETVDNPGEITVGYRRPVIDGSPATMKALKEIEAKLQDILNEVDS